MTSEITAGIGGISRCPSCGGIVSLATPCSCGHTKVTFSEATQSYWFENEKRCPVTSEVSNPNTLIYSDEHNAYWRVGGAGYTGNAAAAGVWTYAEAERMTRHCGPEKRIKLLLRHEVPAVILAEQRREAAAIALWQRCPSHSMEWENETHKAEYLAAVDAVKEALHV